MENIQISDKNVPFIPKTRLMLEIVYMAKLAGRKTMMRALTNRNFGGII